MKKRLLLAYLALTLLPIGACLVHLVAELRATATGPLAAASALGALAFGLGALSLRTVGRAGPDELGFLGARYLRIVFSLKLLAFLIVQFGTLREAFARFAAHLFGAMALHRLALLWPGHLTAALTAIGRRPLLRTAELLLFNVCATIVLAEAVLRAYYAGSGQGFFSAQREHPLTRKLVSELFGAPPNALGYNDKEFQVEKRAGFARVAAVGDSFFVAAVPRRQGVIARTEALLEQDAAPVEIYNFGILGSNLDDYRILLEEEVLGFHPDWVLLGIYVGNDIRIATASTTFYHRSYAIHRALTAIQQRLEARRLVQTGAFRDVTRSADNAVPDLAAPIMTREQYLESMRRELALFSNPSSRAVTRAWYDSFASLSRIAALCRERGVPLLAVVSPSHPQISRALLDEGARVGGVAAAELDVAVPQRRLAEFFAEHGVPVLDLLPVFQRAALERDPAELYLVNDTHWSVPGNEIAAVELARFLAGHLSSAPSRRDAP